MTSFLTCQSHFRVKNGHFSLKSNLPVYSVTVLPGPELISINSAVRGTSDGVLLMSLYKIN